MTSKQFNGVYRPLVKQAWFNACECSGIIRKGERYHVHSGVWGGEAMTYKRCKVCEAVANALDLLSVSSYERVTFGNLIDFVSEENDVLLVRWAENAVERLGFPRQWIVDKALAVEEKQKEREANAAQ